ncbi:flagellin [Hartmannibacter diazotrophicus]|nr:flagellin [Hartmannibacter diazotrophicus]
MSDIVLSNAARASLLSLTQTTELMGKTQGKLATGKKVNSALDNPNSFFTAQGLNNRATDLTNLLDDMGQSIQTLKAADQGISAITKLIAAAKAKANQALQTSDAFDRSQYAREYNDLLDQIEGIAGDSGYKGKNLLGGGDNDLVVYFNEDNSNKLKIGAIDYTDIATTLGLEPVEVGSAGLLTTPLSANSAALLTTSLLTADSADFAAGDIISFKDGNGDEIWSFEVTSATTVSDFVTEVNSNLDSVQASFKAGALTFSVAEDITISGGQTAGAFASATVTAEESDWLTEAGINDTLSHIQSAIESVRLQASTFGTNLTMLENRQDFTKSFAATLEAGADKLVVADMNEEGANLLALQTRQSLSTTALSFATQAEQGVLRLFG